MRVKTDKDLRCRKCGALLGVVVWPGDGEVEIKCKRKGCKCVNRFTVVLKGAGDDDRKRMAAGGS